MGDLTNLINPVSRLTQLLLLAVTILLYNVIAMAIANSLFVSQVGAGNLPFAFIVIGLASLPAYIIFSQIIDRYSRPLLFRYLLLICAFLILGLRFLLTLDNSFVYYLLLIFAFFQWDLSNNILYPSLITDYLTTLEYKKSAPFIGISQAVGTMLGGGITIFLSHYLKTKDLLFCLPIILTIAFLQLIYLENSQRRLDQVQNNNKITIIESLRTFPDIAKHFPLVFFLASSSFLLVIIYLSSEFLWFNIYGQYFSEEALTSFLGLMRIVISLVQVIVLYSLTRPLLSWLGVARMNTVYPLTTLISFAGLLFNFSLGTGIGLHLNGDALYKAINLPVHQLNYNAVPSEFLGRVRTLSDGVIYSLGLTIAGGVLWFCHFHLSLIQITYLAIALTLILLFFRLPMGKFYAQGLDDMIRSNTINLDDFATLRTQLPPQSSNAIRELLTNSDRYVQLKGLELARNLDNPYQFLPEVQQLLLSEDDKIRNGVVELFAHKTDIEVIEELNNLLAKNNPDIWRVTVLEILIINQYRFSPAELEILLTDHHSDLKILAAIAIIEHPDIETDEKAQAWSQIQEYLSTSTAKTIIRIIRHSPHQAELIPLITKLLPQANADIKHEALEALSSIATVYNHNLAEIAIQEVNHPEPLVRIAAFKLLGKICNANILSEVKRGLEDSHPRVRQEVANTLAAYGTVGLSIAQESLSSEQKEVVDAAIYAIAKVRNRQANNILFQHLSPEFELLNRTRKWQEQIPADECNWELLAIAINDYHQYLIQKVLYVLSCLGYSRTVNAVNRILATNDQVDLANAVELLVSLHHRRFVLPLIPLLEKIVNKEEKPLKKIHPNSPWLKKKGYKLLIEALESKQRWITIGALVALAMIPSTLVEDKDPVIRLIAKDIFLPSGQCIPATNSSMNRLLLLKKVALFKNLSLDELFLIDQTLEPQQVLSNETIYTEGSWGEHLYIIAEGTIKIVKNVDGQEQEIKQLSRGQYFGEIALFDNATRWDGAIAVEDSTVLKLEKKRFISLISQRPHIILEICRFLSKRLRETDKYISPLPKSSLNVSSE